MAPSEPARPDDHVTDDLKGLLEYLRDDRGFDFTGYKPSSLCRRIRRRMADVDVASYAAYQDYLQVHPEEFGSLFDTILINVTSFFRDRDAWDYLARRGIPQILEHLPDGGAIRVWSAGCASGEEPYSLAMLLADALGIEAYGTRVRIYATDVDEHALAEARQATYTERQVDSVPARFREAYFAPVGGRYAFAEDLRRSVIFGRHDLVQDAPIAHLHLLSCRNTLMYLNAETQARVLSRFHFALQPGGLLFLGRAEMLTTAGDMFSSVELKHRLFVRVGHGGERQHAPSSSAWPNGQVRAAEAARQQLRVREAAFDAAPVALLAVDLEGRLAAANRRAREYLRIDGRDLGRPFQDLEVSYRPVELRGPIERVLSLRAPVTLPEVEHRAKDGETMHLDVCLVPLGGGDHQIHGVGVILLDVTRHRQLEQDLQATYAALEAAYSHLQVTNAELETTNEELQSTVEELETTNEELQSTGEELETMNEELRAANEELDAMNAELRDRTYEAARASSFVAAVLASIPSAVLAVDRRFTVLEWSPGAEKMWGLTRGEVLGESLFGLDFGLPVERLRDPATRLLLGPDREAEVTLPAHNRRGRQFGCRVRLNALAEHRATERTGVVITMDETG